MKQENPAANESSGMTEVEQLKNELAAIKDELAAVKQEFHSYRDAVSKKFSGHEDELEELEARFEDSEGGVSNDETGSQDSKLLPIERLAQMKEQNKNHPALPKNGRESFDRALSIFENFQDWSKKTPKGRTVTNGLKNLLEAVTGEKLAWRQVYRAMDKVQEWTNGVIEHKTTSRHGHVLVAKERPSSAGNG